MTDYMVFDVFTDTAFGGNPLAVIPDAGTLAEDDLQRIAREFNFSETTFVTPSERSDCDARVRIFTPTQEIPFAGHPTIGTALALHALGRVGDSMQFELGVGPIPVTISDGVARFTTTTPLSTWPDMPVDVVAAAAGLDSSAVRVERHPPVIASVGLPFAIAELTNVEALAQAVPDTAAFRAFEPNWPVETHFDLLIYVRDGTNIRARMFAPLDGIPEDPATGSAAAALTAFLGTLEGHSTGFTISQGAEMGRPSRILSEVRVEDGKSVEVAIAGRAVQTMAGRLTI